MPILKLMDTRKAQAGRSKDWSRLAVKADWRRRCHALWHRQNAGRAWTDFRDHRFAAELLSRLVDNLVRNLGSQWASDGLETLDNSAMRVASGDLDISHPTGQCLLLINGSLLGDASRFLPGSAVGLRLLDQTMTFCPIPLRLFSLRAHLLANIHPMQTAGQIGL